MKETKITRRTATILRRLQKAYPNARISLAYRTPFQLLAAVILSAQCTDKKVNEVTRPIFARYRTAKEFASIPVYRLERMVRQTGFYRAKAKAIHGTAQRVRDQYGNKVPLAMEDLLTLRGVARKTANVVLTELTGSSGGIAVDTHVIRLSRRLGLTENVDPKTIERDLMASIPKKRWRDVTHLLIHHGRAICRAQRPSCDACVLADRCPSAFTFSHFQKQ